MKVGRRCRGCGFCLSRPVAKAIRSPIHGYVNKITSPAKAAGEQALTC